MLEGRCQGALGFIDLFSTFSNPCYSGKTFGGGCEFIFLTDTRCTRLILTVASINGGAYTRGQREQYDAWSTLLEPSEASVGWNWQGLWSYMKKVQSITSTQATYHIQH
jgi:hypothetical protein